MISGVIGLSFDSYLVCGVQCDVSIRRRQSQVVQVFLDLEVHMLMILHFHFWNHLCRFYHGVYIYHVVIHEIVCGML